MKENRTKKCTLLLVLTLLLCGLVLVSCGEKEPESEKLPAAKVGQWEETKVVSETDGLPHEVTMRTVKFERNQEKVKAAVEKYNLSAAGSTVTLDNDEDVEYVICYYETTFPAEYPQSEYGIFEMPKDFAILSDSGTEDYTVDNVHYSGLGQVVDIAEQPKGYDFHAGDTYEGALLFQMIKRYDGYVVTYSYEEEGQVKTTYFAGK